MLDTEKQHQWLRTRVKLSTNRRAKRIIGVIGLTLAAWWFLGGWTADKPNSVPSGESARSAAKTYGTHPHLAGSPQDFADAKTMLKFFQEQLGIRPPRSEPIFPAGTPKSRSATISLTEIYGPRSPTAWIDIYYPEMDTPLGRSLDLLNEEGYSAWHVDLEEDGDPADPDAYEYRNFIPAWHGFSGHGEAEGHLVYVNYGTKEDYDELVEAGTNFTGKIVMARYGMIKRAEELGAAGVLLFSDPRDDGYVTVENGYAAYPHGPARNPTSIQRGSTVYLSQQPGDPTTPGRPAYERAKREEPTSIPKIPSLPISWQNAERLLEEIEDIYAENTVAVNGRRSLSGKSSESRVRMVNHVEYKITPIWNTMASIPGHIRDEVIVIGCHRDAWVLGGADPVSGTAALHEIVRGFGELLRQGWKPLRTILIASWDAEEHGLVGSTEYGEDFAEWISEHAVAYINVDVATSGSKWNVYGSPSLAHLIKQTALDVPHPITKGKTLWDARDDEGPFTGLNGSARVDVEYIMNYERAKRQGRASKTGVNPLGSGSDYTVFLQRLGVASTDQGFGGTPYDAPYHYHSIYDSVRWQEEYADPGYHRHVAVAQHLGLMAMRLTDSIIIPLNTTQYAFELEDYADSVERLASEMNDSGLTLDLKDLRSSISLLQKASIKLDKEKIEAEENFKDALSKLPRVPGMHADRTQSCRMGLFIQIADWFKSLLGIRSSAHRAVHKYHAQRWEEYLSRQLLAANGFDEDFEEEKEDVDINLPKNPILEFIKAANRISRSNKKLVAFERGFIDNRGIKDREWYRHLGVAPGKWLGYGATTFPALSEAIAIDKNLTAAKYEVKRLVELLDKSSLPLVCRLFAAQTRPRVQMFRTARPSRPSTSGAAILIPSCIPPSIQDMASVGSVTRQIAALELNKKATSTARPPLHTKQPTQTNVARLLTKYAAPLPAQQNTTTKAKPVAQQPSKVASSSSSPAPEATQPGIDIGNYDGGLELENEKRGEKIFGEAAEDLALDSSSASDFSVVATADPLERRALADRIRDACINVMNHGIPEDVIIAAVEAGKKFFALPESSKMELDIHKSPNFKGYTALLGENTDPNGKGDLHEGFDIGWEEKDQGSAKSNPRDDREMSGANVWPELPGFRENVLGHAAVQLGRSLFPLFALALDLPENFFNDKTTKPAAIMRLLHYPPQNPTKMAEDGSVIGIGAHTDYEVCATVLGNRHKIDVILEYTSALQFFGRTQYPAYKFRTTMENGLMQFRFQERSS
ncbi:vacuolar protein sorting-associated protein 70 [Moniliophthora roreri]|nr:vacuolar protein sorting-associated protein 70 [Moniliophthora roreri]